MSIRKSETLGFLLMLGFLIVAVVWPIFTGGLNFGHFPSISNDQPNAPLRISPLIGAD